MQRLCILSTMQYMVASSLFQRIHQLFWMRWEATKATTEVCVWWSHHRTSSFVFGARRRLYGVSQHTRSNHHWLHSTTTEPAHVSLLIIIVLTCTYYLVDLVDTKFIFPWSFVPRPSSSSSHWMLNWPVTLRGQCRFRLHTSALHHKSSDT